MNSFEFGPQITLGFIQGISPVYLLIIGATMLASFLVSSMLKKRFAEYSQQYVPLSGKEIAERMLSENGIHDVAVISVAGKLTDHYNPLDKTVNLSEDVYSHRSVAAAAVAAHECGHAIQHASAYKWLTFRSKMVPAVSIANNMLNILMMVFIVGFFVSQSPMLIWAMVLCLAVVAGFSIVTLPVEFDASKRALEWMSSSGVGGAMEMNQAKNALFWAAMTYVVAALSSVAMLVYWLIMLLGRDE